MLEESARAWLVIKELGWKEASVDVGTFPSKPDPLQASWGDERMRSVSKGDLTSAALLPLTAPFLVIC